MDELRFAGVCDVQRRWAAVEADLREVGRRLATTPVGALPASVQAVGRIFLDVWSGHARESADLAGGFVLALSAADYTFRGTDGYVAEELLHLDGRLGPQR